ncbi:MAG TPA: SDR family NAD(P)-dependent oxidoreductase [Saprospiraceae bacterium]|nr:SDR family NAD(P)-dependent oxidoreductase [Saprospiraceae bacterium]
MKTILITGATSGIGRATAHRFAKDGSYKLVLCGRRKERLEHLKKDLESRYQVPVAILDFDVRSFDACRKAIAEIPDSFRPVDILLNNAGLAKGLDFIHEGKLEDWETMIDTNIKGLLYMTKLVSEEMVQHKSGHIINISSTAGKDVYPKGNVYSATKFAVDALTKSIRQDLAGFDIRVSQVAPGHVEETEFAITRFDGDAEKANIYSDFNPLKAEDVADIIHFIATRPPHVDIMDVLVMGTQQPSATMVHRVGRKYD